MRNKRIFGNNIHSGYEEYFVHVGLGLEVCASEEFSLEFAMVVTLKVYRYDQLRYTDYEYSRRSRR